MILYKSSVPFDTQECEGTIVPVGECKVYCLNKIMLSFPEADNAIADLLYNSNSKMQRMLNYGCLTPHEYDDFDYNALECSLLASW